MKRFLCLFLTLVLLAASIVIPTTAYAEETINLTKCNEYVYDEKNFEFVKNTYAKEDVSIDYSKITVFEDPTEFRSYLLSQNLAFNDCCESLNDFYYVINDGRGQGAPDSYESQFYLGPHVFNYYSYDIKDNKKLIINGNEFDCVFKLNLKHLESDEYAEKYYDAVHSALNEMNLTGLSDYAKAVAILDWIEANISYDYEAFNNEKKVNNIAQTIVEKKGICENYADVVHMFCTFANIESYKCGSIHMDHAFNAIKIDGMWYFADATFGNYANFPKRLYSSLKSANEFAGDHSCPDIDFDNLYDVTGFHYGVLSGKEPYFTLKQDNDFPDITENKLALDFEQNILRKKPNEDEDKIYDVEEFAGFVSYNIGKTEIKPFTEDLLNNPKYTNSPELNLGYIDYETEEITDKACSSYVTNRTAYYTPDDIFIKNAQNYSCVLNNYSGDKCVKISETNYKLDQYGNPTDELCEISEERIIEKGQSVPNKGHNLVVSEEKNAEFCTDPTSITYKCTDCDYCVEVVTESNQSHDSGKWSNTSVLRIYPETCTEDEKIEIAWIAYNGEETIYNENNYICSKCGYNTGIKTPEIAKALGHNIITEISKDGTLERKYCTNSKHDFSIKGADLRKNETLSDYYKNGEGDPIFTNNFTENSIVTYYSNNNPSVTVKFKSKDCEINDFIGWCSFIDFNCEQNKRTKSYRYKNNQWQTYDYSTEKYTPTENPDDFISIKTNGDYTTITVKNCNGLWLANEMDESRRNIMRYCLDENSLITFSCDSPCDYEEITELKHNYKLTTTVASTCQTQGYNEYTCTYCRDTYREPLELADHTPIYKGYQEPTCTASGHTNLTICSVCGEILNKGEEIAPLGHSYTCTTISPTCSQKGYDLYTCERCGNSYKDNIIAPTGVHKIVIDKSIAPTCTKDGLTEGSHCSTCGLVLEKQKIINKTGHKYDNGVVVVAPTCTKTGIKLYSCKACNNTLTVVIDKNSHTYKNYVTKATMSSNGSIVNKCSLCGAKKSTSTIYKVSSVALSTYSTYYNGSVKTPSVTVKDSKGKTLKKGTDYDVTYASGRKNVGRYAVTIKFKGNYSGTKTLYFNIIPKGTSISKLTATSKGFKAQWKTQKTQTTGYQIQYSTSSNFSNAKTITMPKNTYSAKSITKLLGKKKYYVRIRTYKVTKFGGKNYNIYSPWSSAKSVTTKK